MNKKFISIFVSLFVMVRDAGRLRQAHPHCSSHTAPVATEAPTVEPTAIPTPIRLLLLMH